VPQIDEIVSYKQKCHETIANLDTELETTAQRVADQQARLEGGQVVRPADAKSDQLIQLVARAAATEVRGRVWRLLASCLAAPRVFVLWGARRRPLLQPNATQHFHSCSLRPALSFLVAVVVCLVASLALVRAAGQDAATPWALFVAGRRCSSLLAPAA
jgi:hypothetical protein